MSPALVFVCVWSLAGAPQAALRPSDAAPTAASAVEGDATPANAPASSDASTPASTGATSAKSKSAESKSAESKSAEGKSAESKSAESKSAESKKPESKSAPRRGPPPTGGPPPAPEAFARISPPTRDLTIDDVHWTAWTGGGVIAGAVVLGIATITTVVIGGIVAADIGEGGRANEDVDAALRSKAVVDITAGVLAFSTAATVATGAVFGGYGLALLEDSRRQDAPQPALDPGADEGGLGKASSSTPVERELGDSAPVERELGDSAPSEGAANEGATNEGATSEGATNEGATNEGATNEGAASEGAPSEGATSEGETSESATSESATSKGAAPPTP